MSLRKTVASMIASRKLFADRLAAGTTFRRQTSEDNRDCPSPTGFVECPLSDAERADLQDAISKLDIAISERQQFPTDEVTVISELMQTLEMHLVDSFDGRNIALNDGRRAAIQQLIAEINQKLTVISQCLAHQQALSPLDYAADNATKRNEQAREFLKKLNSSKQADENGSAAA